MGGFVSFLRNTRAVTLSAFWTGCGLVSTGAGRSGSAIGAGGGNVSRITFSRDGRRLISTGRDGTLKVWDTTIGLPVLTIDGSNIATAIGFSADGRRLTLMENHGVLKTWEAPTFPAP